MLPQDLVTATAKAFPGLWRDLDSARARSGHDLPLWPAEVFFPMPGWYALARNLFRAPQLTPEQVIAINSASFAAAWRPGQDVARFDPDTLAALFATTIDGEIPSDSLWRLPAWCVCIEAQLEYGEIAWDGFLAMPDMDQQSRRLLRLRFFSAEADFDVTLQPGEKTIPAMLEAELNRARNAAATIGLDSASFSIDSDNFLPGLQKAISLLLYVCAYWNEGAKSDTASSSRPAPKKVKTGWRLFPPPQPRIRLLGEAIGAKIRAAHTNPGLERKGPAPHIRTAHWHGFWHGPHKGERQFKLHWLPPIAVAMKDE